jgi:hypothetical protein
MHDFYFPPNVIKVVKWQKMREFGHVACMEEERHAYRVLGVGET